MSAVDEGEVLLTDLCAICHIKPLKYTCPRCAIQTCSLPCVKKHKLRAQCSGIRDPAAYKKRSDLSTASSIDQDYNFITKVERSLQRADDDVHERGITLAPAPGVRYHGSRGSKSKTEVEIDACGITVIRTPQVFSRSKQNATRWDGRHKCLMWTVEWVLHDGRTVIANSRGSNSVAYAYANSVGKRGLPRKRKFDEGKTHQEKAAENDEDQAARSNEDRHTEEAAHDESAPKTPGSTELARRQVADVNFYLHRPKTTSKLKCLIPIDPELSICNILRDRTIIEFPTIYATFERPEELVAPFITEAAYLQDYGEELSIPVEPQIQLHGESGEIDGLHGGDFDEKKLLEGLQKDLAG